MNVSVSINLGADDPEDPNADEVAQQILELLGGDPDKDTCFVNIGKTAQVGAFAPGPVPPPPPAPPA